MHKLNKIYDSNLFFLTLLAFAFVLPLSPALISIVGVIMLVVAISEDGSENKVARLKGRRFLLCLVGIFGLYVLSTIFTLNEKKSLYDVQKSVFFFILPLAFLFGKDTISLQKRMIFYAFILGVIISIIVSLLTYIYTDLHVRDIGLISHIRFSFHLILASWFLILFSQFNYKSSSKGLNVTIVLLVIIIVGFLFFQQSLTGIIAFFGSFVIYVAQGIFKLKKRYRFVVLLVVFSILIIPFHYIYQAINSFYNIDKIELEQLDKKTKLGNIYKHDINSKWIENGNYVNLYFCEEELRIAWDSRSSIKFDSLGNNGYPINSTIIRYLTSAGLRKDAEGVDALSMLDVKNIENGMANIIEQKRFSLYPRIYQTTWEYYAYTQIGYVNNQSFSQRIEFAKAAILIIKENLWFGVGTGSWKEEFSKAFKQNNAEFNERWYASSHNQYLNYMVKFGLLGFIIIMSLIIYPIVKTKVYGNLLFQLFIGFLFLANFADSNFESHNGSAFFVFFFCLFLTMGKSNFMQLEK